MAVEFWGKAHRLIGFLEGDVFYALIGCTHQQQVYDPPEALDTASKRQRHIKNKEVTTVEYAI